MRREKLFIDTGAWIALAASRDQYHKIATTFYRLLPPSVQRVSSSHVISETFTWLRYKAGFDPAATFLKVIRQAKENGSLTVLTDDLRVLEGAEQLLHDFPDQKISYTDAVSMEIMHRERIGKVFGFDRHFRLLNFELAPGHPHE